MSNLPQSGKRYHPNFTRQAPLSPPHRQITFARFKKKDPVLLSKEKTSRNLVYSNSLTVHKIQCCKRAKSSDELALAMNKK